jgi:GR25 family glycosyltransferase involved in LPS biosynthesis
MSTKPVWVGIAIGGAIVALLQPPPKTWPHVPRVPLGEFDVYVINVDVATARLTHFRGQIARSDLATKSFIRFEAIKGSDLDLPTVVSRRALWEISNAEATGYRLRHYQLSRNAVACYMSHVQLWRSVLETDKAAALIFEDDAIVHPQIGEFLKNTPFPEDYDIVLLGYVCLACARDEGAGFHRVYTFFGLHGYVISARGIKKLLESRRIFPVRKQIDTVLSEMATAGEITVYASPRKLVEQNNAAFGTSIQIPLKEGVDPWAALSAERTTTPTTTTAVPNERTTNTARA